MDFHYLLMANHAMVQKYLMKKLADTNLTLGQPKILDYLGLHNGASQTEIAASCYIEAASLTSALNGMEAKGLVERRRMNGNRRTYYIYLTPKGEEMYRKVADAFSEIEQEIFSEIPPETAALFGKTFTDIHKKLKNRLEEE